MLAPVGLAGFIGRQHLLYALSEGYALALEEGVVLLDDRLEGGLELVNADVHVPVDNRVPQVLPLVDPAGEGEPDLQVAELLVKPDLLDQSIDKLEGVLVASFLGFLG